MYTAKGNQVFYYHPKEKTEELFLTVHPTKDCTVSVEDQASALADILNEVGS